MNKRQRKKQARHQAKKQGYVYKPRNTFRSTMSIQSTLFDVNHPKNEKMVYLAERNLNRLAFVITKPGIVNLTNLTEDDVKFLQSPKFSQDIDNIYHYFEYDRSHYKDPEVVDNIVRKVMTKYFYYRGVQSTQALDNAIKRLTKQMEQITKVNSKCKDNRRFNNPFVIVYYSEMELR